MNCIQSSCFLAWLVWVQIFSCAQHCCVCVGVSSSVCTPRAWFVRAHTHVGYLQMFPCLLLLGPQSENNWEHKRGSLFSDQLHQRLPSSTILREKWQGLWSAWGSLQYWPWSSSTDIIRVFRLCWCNLLHQSTLSQCQLLTIFGCSGYHKSVFKTVTVL